MVNTTNTPKKLNTDQLIRSMVRDSDGNTRKGVSAAKRNVREARKIKASLRSIRSFEDALED